MWPRDLCYVRYWRRNDDGSYGNLLSLFPCLKFWLIGVYKFSIVVLQLCYFVLGSMRTVVHSQDMCGHILRVSSVLSFEVLYHSRDEN